MTQKEIFDILAELVKVAPVVAVLFIALRVVWRDNKQQREMLLDAFTKSIKATEEMRGSIDKLESRLASLERIVHENKN